MLNKLWAVYNSINSNFRSELGLPINTNVHVRSRNTSGLCHSDGLHKHKKIRYHLYGKCISSGEILNGVKLKRWWFFFFFCTFKKFFLIQLYKILQNKTQKNSKIHRYLTQFNKPELLQHNIQLHISEPNRFIMNTQASKHCKNYQNVSSLNQASTINLMYTVTNCLRRECRRIQGQDPARVNVTCGPEFLRIFWKTLHANNILLLSNLTQQARWFNPQL